MIPARVPEGVYDDAAPLLLISDEGRSAAGVRQSAEAAGLRVVGPVAVAEAADRLSLQARASVLWLDALEPEGLPEALLDRLVRSAVPAIVATNQKGIDPIFARFADSDVTILVDPAEADCAAAIALATSAAFAPGRVSDVASDNSARLRQLSDEVNRIAATLARLSSASAVEVPAVIVSSDGDIPDIAPERVRAVVRARRLRSRYFSGDLFADPAWDMLLDLLQAELSHVRVPVSSLCIAAAVPATTALRWLKTMVDEGIFVRRADPHDGRRVFVELAPEASAAMRRYFSELDTVAA